jgi:hypothetical protein
MKSSANNNFHESFKNIFKKNEKENFLNEINTLNDDITTNGLTEFKTIININYILFKLYELDNNYELYQEILKEKKNKEVKNEDEDEINYADLFKIYINKNKFNDFKRFMIDNLFEYLLKIENINFGVLKSSIEKIVSKMQNDEDIRLKENNLLAYLESKIDQLKNNKLIHTIKDSYNKDKIIYKLNIFYDGGVDSCSQLCNIESRALIDYPTFIYKLKRKLGIYEHSTFKIVILNRNKDEIEILKEIEQLSIDHINLIKIVPFDYIIKN